MESILRALYSWPTTGIIVGVGAPIFTMAFGASYMLTAPFSNTAYHTVDHLLYAGYQNFCALFFESGAGATYIFHGDRPRVETAIYLSNHQSTVDWFIVNVMAKPLGMMGTIRYILKDTLKLMPLYGWYFALHGCVYVRTNSQKDEARIRSSLSYLRQSAFPFWLVIFPEGHRYTPAHMLTSQEFSRKKGLPELSHVLTPRSKGLHLCVQELDGKADAIYDVTIAYTKNSRNGPRVEAPSMWDLMTGYYKEVHVHVKRIPLADVPKDDKLCAEWLYARFVEKDRMLREFYEEGKDMEGETWVNKNSRMATFMKMVCFTCIAVPFVATDTGRKALGWTWLVAGLGGTLAMAAGRKLGL